MKNVRSRKLSKGPPKDHTKIHTSSDAGACVRSDAYTRDIRRRWTGSKTPEERIRNVSRHERFGTKVNSAFDVPRRSFRTRHLRHERRALSTDCLSDCLSVGMNYRGSSGSLLRAIIFTSTVCSHNRSKYSSFISLGSTSGHHMRERNPNPTTAILGDDPSRTSPFFYRTPAP